ncbi:MAG: hypothetical protein ACREA2_15990 [Blastocatellia bacterium]
MAYFSVNEDFQRLGSSCGGHCQCGPCSQRHAGRAALAEWYEREEDEPETPAGSAPQSAIRNPQSAIGEPPPRPPDLFRLSPEFQRQMMERWERERRNRELFSPPPPPPQRMTLQEAIDRFLDNSLNRLMSDLRIPPGLRDPIRNAARAAIGRGAEELLDRSLTQMGLSSKAREAIGASVRAAMRQIPVR